MTHDVTWSSNKEVCKTEIKAKSTADYRDNPKPGPMSLPALVTLGENGLRSGKATGWPRFPPQADQTATGFLS